MQAVAYSLARDGVFATLQGEGHLSGARMVFVRFAGCSVGCVGCDTDYRLHERVELIELVRRIRAATPYGLRDRWVWLTGGEPLDQPNLRHLLRALKAEGYSTALATSGHKRAIDPVDWLSVSPHDDSVWVQRFGDECKIVPWLNGARFEDFDFDRSDFLYYYAQPFDGDKVSRQQCLEWCEKNPNWLMTEQNHKLWGLR